MNYHTYQFRKSEEEVFSAAATCTGFPTPRLRTWWNASKRRSLKGQQEIHRCTDTYFITIDQQDAECTPPAVNHAAAMPLVLESGIYRLAKRSLAGLAAYLGADAGPSTI